MVSTYRRLEASMPRVQHELPNYTIRLRRIGSVTASLVGAGEYRRTMERPDSKLSLLGSVAVARHLDEAVATSESLHVWPRVVGCGLLQDAKNGVLSVSYFLDPEPLLAERQRLTEAIDELGGIGPSRWSKQFAPRVHVAVIGSPYVDPRIEEVFTEVGPQALPLLPPRIIPDEPM